MVLAIGCLCMVVCVVCDILRATGTGILDKNLLCCLACGVEGP
jgi:hypothetical protein